MIVTGGGRGIGAATARLAAQRGYAVCINYLSHEAAARALVDEIEAAGGRAMAKQGDTRPPIGRLDDADGETLRTVVEVNVLGVMYCARAAVQRMSNRHGGTGGSIVNLSSAAATLGSPGEFVWYAASKGAVDSFTVGLAREVGGEGIRVNAVQPGMIATEIHGASGDAGRLARLGGSCALGRPGEAEEVAEPILWLCSEAASYVTGAILRVGGGR